MSELKRMIRYATLDDYEQVELIIRQVQSLHVAWRPDVYLPVEPVILEDHFKKLVKEQSILVCEHWQQVVGVASFMERIVTGRTKVTKKTLFIEDIAVLKDYRGKEIGRALLKNLETIAKDRACTGIELLKNHVFYTEEAYFNQSFFLQLFPYSLKIKA